MKKSHFVQTGHHYCQLAWLSLSHFLVTGATGCSLNIVFFSWKFCDCSELCQFCCSAGFLPACFVYTNWHRGKTEFGIFWKNRKKTQYLMNTLYILLRYHSSAIRSEFWKVQSSCRKRILEPFSERIVTPAFGDNLLTINDKLIFFV